MEINIIYQNITIKKELGEYDVVVDVINEIRGGTFVINLRFNQFNLIFNNIILNVEKYVQFYKIQENDSIYLGNLEDYLKENQIVVEIIFLYGLSESIFLIMDRNSKISEIKDIINKLIPNSSKLIIFDQNYEKIEEDEKIKEIYKKDSNRKIFMRYSKFNLQPNFADLYHRELIKNYFWNGLGNENWGNEYNTEVKEDIGNLRRIISNKIRDDSMLLLNLMENKKLLKGSKFPICKIYSECLYEIFEKHMNNQNRPIFVNQNFPHVYSYIRLALMIKIDDVLTKKKKSKSKKKEIQNCTLGQILLDALELLENQVTDGSCIMKLFVERFFLSNFKSENFNDFRRNCLEDYAVIKINPKFTETLQIPLGQRTLKELKEITSWHFGITPNDLHFVGYEKESITDSEKITLTKNMTIHFIYILKFIFYLNIMVYITTFLSFHRK